MPACERPVTHLNVGLRHLDADRLLLGCRIALTVNEVCLLLLPPKGRAPSVTGRRARWERDAAGALARDVDRRLAGSGSGSDTEPSVSVCACVSTLWDLQVHVGTVSREATVKKNEKYDSRSYDRTL